MKRFFFLASSATAMLAACNKTEIVPTGDAQEISFVAVNKVATKVPVDGTTFQNEFTMPTYYLTFVLSEDFLEKDYSLIRFLMMSKLHVLLEERDVVSLIKKLFLLLYR